MRKLFFIGVCVSAFLFSCTSSETVVDKDLTKDVIEGDSSANNTGDNVIPEIDTTSAIDDNGYVDEEKEMMQAANADVPQWDFCTCILAADSINKAMEDADDAAFDALMARDEIVSKKCKIILAHKSDTPEARKKHEKKVKKCLRNAQ